VPEPAPITPEPTPTAPTKTTPARAKTAPLPSAPEKVAPAVGAGTDRIGSYLTQDEVDGARGAYLADWSNGGEADTFARWIAAAMDTHAARTPQQRAARGNLRGRAAERSGASRSFSIPTSTVKRMRTAITADQNAGRWPSDSASCAEAIALATEDARSRNGGTLPTPPARLPNRLVR